MLLKLFVTNEMLHEVQTWKTSVEIWKHLKELHETSHKGRAFFLKNMLFLSQWMRVHHYRSTYSRSRISENNLLDNHSIDRITEKYTITRDTSFILGNPHGGENPTKTSLI
jgi:hypothetical protein